MVAIKIIKMKSSDWNQINEIQKECYSSNYYEDKNVFDQMLHYFSDGCLVAVDNKTIVGYIIFHPYIKGLVKPLNTKIESIKKPDCLNIHDLSIKPSYRGKGISKLFMKEADRVCKKLNFNTQVLVAVQNSEPFWENYGFKIVKKINYGHKNAYYMIRILNIHYV